MNKKRVYYSISKRLRNATFKRNVIIDNMNLGANCHLPHLIEDVKLISSQALL